MKTLFLTILFAATTALATGYPLTLQDDLGREVTLEREPERIVSMLPSHTEVICALDACDKLVGIDDFSDFPTAVDALPRLGGGLFGANIEAIIALEPDLVLASEYGELAQTLAQAGLIVYAGSAQTYEEAFEKFQLLGRLVNREAEAGLLAEQVRGEIEEIAMMVEGREAPSVYYEVDPTPYSVGPQSFIGTLIGLAGGDNIVSAEMGEFPQLDPEFIVARDPDVIVLGSAPYGESLETLAARPGWEGLTALQTNAVIELDEKQVNVISRPGPRMAEAVRLLASIFHPDLF